jgi:hypothetical protein
MASRGTARLRRPGTDLAGCPPTLRRARCRAPAPKDEGLCALAADVQPMAPRDMAQKWLQGIWRRRCAKTPPTRARARLDPGEAPAPTHQARALYFWPKVARSRPRRGPQPRLLVALVLPRHHRVDLRDVGPVVPRPTQRVRLVRGEGRGVSDQYGVRDAACPISTRGGGAAAPLYVILWWRAAREAEVRAGRAGADLPGACRDTPVTSQTPTDLLPALSSSCSLSLEVSDAAPRTPQLNGRFAGAVRSA